ncbi:hypothetical protein [Paenibacillus sp. BC26]|nr:hypothetical protein [Paenibacillus sp. BC26]
MFRENGQVGAIGTHDVLIAQDGLYLRFWQVRVRAERWQVSAAASAVLQ